MEERHIPCHLGIIMDGNGRWAQKNGKKRSYGHRKGALNVEKIVEHAFRCGVSAVSLFAFSSENWKRPKEEVDAILDLIRDYFDRYLKRLVKNGVAVRVMGETAALPDDLRASIARVVAETAGGSNTLNIGINYGGRQEIVRAAALLCEKRSPVTEEAFSAALDTAGLPPLDFLIRTGGEKRLSNFMLFEAAYAELYFTDVYWPDFGKAELDAALEDYSRRKRRFGSL